MIILQWWIAGLIVTYIAVAAHLIRAEMKGYDAIEWHKKNTSIDGSKLIFIFRFIFGLTIWPVRFCELICEVIPHWYNEYERK